MAIQRLHAGKRYSEASIHNGIVYLTGIVSEDGATDIRGQTADVLAQIDAMLTEAGSDKHHILHAQIFLADIKDAAGMNEVWDAWVSPGSPPSRATVQAALVDAQWRIEIVVTAAQKTAG